MIRLIILVAILVLALSFFGISIRTILESPTGQDNVTYLWEIISTGFSIILDWVKAFWDFLTALIVFWK